MSFIERIREENRELSEKMLKLKDFMHTDLYVSLPAVEQGLLMVQLEAMEMYQETLARRLEIYSGKP